MIIIGAGLAGLTAAALLRDEAKEIWEAQPSLPNNHSALLRFKSSILGDSLNIPFKKVQVIKDIDTTGNDLRDILQYSKKSNGSYSVRSIKKEISERYIAPPDFPDHLQKKVMAKFKFSTQLQTIFINGHLIKPNIGPIISTIPMPMLLKVLTLEEDKFGLGKSGTNGFEARNGYVLSVEIKNCDMYCTMYFPSNQMNAYRASITGSKLIIEYSDQQTFNFDARGEIALVCLKMGINVSDIKEETMQAKEQKFMKILPIDEEKRKRIILWLTEEFGIYSFGRFATWKPGLLLDDLVKDLRVIQKIVASKNTYDQRR